MIRTFILLLLFGFSAGKLYAQDVPLGTWQSHFSYRSARHILQIDQKIYCSTYNGLFSIDPADNQISSYSKVNGLSDAGISSMAYDTVQNLLMLAYRSGNLDLVYLNDKAEPEEIINWNFLSDASGLPESRQITKIRFRENKAYLSTNFGIVVLDPKRREVEETYRYIGPGGAEVQVTDMTFTRDSIFAATSQGLLSASLDAAVNKQYYLNWKNISVPFKTVALSYQNGNLYTGFSGEGIYRKEKADWKLIYQSADKQYHFSEQNNLVTLSDRIVVLNQDKPVVYENPIFSKLQETLISNAYFWTADGKQGLLSNKEGAFRSYSPAESDTTFLPGTDSSVVDLNGLTWSRLPDYLGGGISIADTKTNRQRILSTAANNGGLPASAIHSLSLDTDGYIWFASDRGVGYFIPDDVLSGTALNAILPVYGQRKLFANERCNAIVTEPGNRKWIGTDKGLFQFTADGTELLKQFTAADSPLPSNRINALHFAGDKGLLFAETPNGMVSYRSDASTSAPDLSSVMIFPNPVRPNFEGDLGIKGLVENSVIKFTDLSGRLVYETRSQGGTASWNLNDYTGKRIRGGIYLVIMVSPDKKEKLAGKLAVIN